MSYIVLDIAFGEGEKWQLAVCGLVIVMYTVSLILLWRKKRIFAVGPMLLHAAGVMSTIYLAIAVAEEPMAVLGGLPFLLTCFEAWEAFMFFRCFFRCKDIKALTQKNDNETESVTIK